MSSDVLARCLWPGWRTIQFLTCHTHSWHGVTMVRAVDRRMEAVAGQLVVVESNPPASAMAGTHKG